MEIKSSDQIIYEELQDVNFDLLIAASGYEERSRYFCQKFLKINKPKYRLCLGFNNNRDKFDRLKNDNFFKKNDFVIKLIDGNSFSEVQKIILEYLTTLKTDRINILIDYSSMTRIWYGGLIKFFSIYTNSKISMITLYFVYSSAKYVLPPKERFPNSTADTILEYSKIDDPNKKMALIIGLGLEIYRAAGLFEFLYSDSLNTYIFYNQAVENELNKTLIHRINELLLGHIPENHFYKYDLHDFKSTYATLNVICLYLESRGNRVVLAPLGPKPFGLLCFIIAAKNNFPVYRASGGVIRNVIPDKKKEILTLRLQYQSTITE